MGQVLNRGLTAGVVIATLSIASGARAAGPEERKAEALFREGRAAVDRGDWATGCAKFAESLKLVQSAGPLVNLAQCDERNGDLVAASDHWKRGIALLPPTDERTAPARERAAALDKRVPRIVISLDPTVPAGARITIDAIDLDRAAAAEPLPYNPGGHTIVVSAPGRGEWRSTLVLVEGELRRVTPVLLPLVPTTPEGPGMSGLRVAGIVVGAAGFASLVVGAVTGGLTIGKKNEVDDNCVHGCNDAARDASLAGRTLSAVSTATFIVGLAGIGAGVVMIVMGKPKPPPAVARAAAIAKNIAPWMARDGGGAIITYRF